MNKNKKVSMAVIRRLPKYYRYLSELINKDIKRISSYELSKLTGFTASQIRQDFNNFGGFGQQGYGYNIEELYKQLKMIIGIDKPHSGIIIGAGNLGQSIANYKHFDETGFNIVAIFEKNPRLIGYKIREIPILDFYDIEEFCKDKDIGIAVITTPKQDAQAVADKVVSLGIESIWNFAPVDLKTPDNVVVESIHLSESLLALMFMLNNK
ncbi:MAG: redox-sensing transcriptional repressor Rex [Andreesenia angusta]|nr:redox-sensing transcriptional repressor Rex [Andreesenia angusta]